ncbi:hypothetical protein F2Q68_00009588 [Brassica cretica]|nr:hypothetical protein F2Q68_00009588 [Brassica cretica]
MFKWNWIGNLRNIDSHWWSLSSVILGIQLNEHVAHPGVDFRGYLIQRLGLNLLTLQQLLHHHTQTLQLIWLTVPGSWNSLPIALRLSLVLVLNLTSRSLLHAEDVPLSAHVVPAARERPVQQHHAKLGWSAAFEAFVIASVATEHSWLLNVTNSLVRFSEYVYWSGT